MTQPTVSVQVRSLEDSIGCALFDRNAQFVRLTTDGEAMLGYARELLAVLARARQQFAQPPLEGLVRFGMVEDFGATVLPDMLGRLRREHPRFEVITETGTSPDLLRRLDAGSLDLVLAKRVAGRQQGAFLCRQRLVWVGQPSVLKRESDIVPLLASHLSSAAELGDVARNIFVHLVSGTPIGINVRRRHGERTKKSVGVIYPPR